MEKNVKQIYLAGKVRGKKWELIEDIKNDDKYQFLASDGEYEETEIGEVYNHGYSFDKPHNVIKSWEDNEENIVYFALFEIKHCDFLFAYLDKTDSYGSIAEMAYASAIGKPIFLVINESEINKDDMEINSPFLDSYWFVSNFPNIKRIFTDFEGAKHLLESLCKIESPIEQIFYNACIKNNLWYKLFPQVEEGKYRIDFAIPDEKIAIELDGHDSHKTKEQRTHDAQRERYLQSNGWKLIRFTGSEIYNNLNSCLADLSLFREANKQEKKELF